MIKEFVLNYFIVERETLAQLRGIACISQSRTGLRPAAALLCTALLTGWVNSANVQP